MEDLSEDAQTEIDDVKTYWYNINLCCMQAPTVCECPVQITPLTAERLYSNIAYEAGSPCEVCVHYTEFSCPLYRAYIKDDEMRMFPEAINGCEEFIWESKLGTITSPL